jgi:hypothetical protein
VLHKLNRTGRNFELLLHAGRFVQQDQFANWYC